MPVSNQQITEHTFLRSLYRDDYYPDHVVDLGKAILLRLCERVETEHPADLPALYALTEVATEEFNALQADFEAAEQRHRDRGPRGDGRGLLVRGERVRLRGRGRGGADRCSGLVSGGAFRAA